MKKKALPLLGFLSLLALTGAAMGSKAPLPAQDTAWLKAAHQGNLAEIQAGQYAHGHGHSHSVREVGQTLVEDHQMLDSKVTKAARQFGVPLPQKPTATATRKLEATKAKHGLVFDKAWVHMEIGAHIEAIRKTEAEITDGQSQKVVKLAKAALPVLKKHLHLLNVAGMRLRGNG